ncbi:uncharacterized protein L969DRAFT_624929 [Mixia osmundae IAM 14324]|uniref:Uncharacterized protein n=1 Tax=Mixia osmundae (strain CBS 9802 / IAM 14324 / JCM 22182 / KY 12970) TaxID=764103 RepID=G7E7E9_MIXOS|nr:uncharacterized protein L969DRAFT_624929 [Mixia osmundae IAM 14324]KEI38918.1 hypothetical protein L969DRAFT_624929 [Mixia osmundae IAM 14324]GAA98759.1 hypothetical protein E5Q_05447 [Mixia osmundae IAM 14324]
MCLRSLTSSQQPSHSIKRRGTKMIAYTIAALTVLLAGTARAVQYDDLDGGNMPRCLLEIHVPDVPNMATLMSKFEYRALDGIISSATYLPDRAGVPTANVTPAGKQKFKGQYLNASRIQFKGNSGGLDADFTITVLYNKPNTLDLWFIDDMSVNGHPAGIANANLWCGATVKQPSDYPGCSLDKLATC